MSDRIEKEDPGTSLLLKELEHDSIRVVRGDWNVHLGLELRGGRISFLFLTYIQFLLLSFPH